MKADKKPAHSAEDVKWMRKVIDQERTKPLEVSKDFVLSYERKEKERSSKLSENVDRHIETLRALRQKVESRSETIARSSEYRQWRREFNPKKNAVLLGKPLDEGDLTSKSIKPGKERTVASHSIDHDIDKYGNLSEKTKGNTNKDLMNVLNSLQKLSELETRISSLETNNALGSMMNDQINGPDIPATTTLQFKKQRNFNVTDKAMKMTYTLNLSKGRTNVYSSRPIKPKHGAAKIIPKGKAGPNPRSGVFITEYKGSKTQNPKSAGEADQMSLRYC